MTAIEPPGPSERVYGERGDYDLAVRRARRFWPGENVEVRPVLEPRTPVAGGTSSRYFVRVWAGRVAGTDIWYYIRPCVVGRDKRPGMKMESWSYIKALPVFDDKEG